MSAERHAGVAVPPGVVDTALSGTGLLPVSGQTYDVRGMFEAEVRTVASRVADEVRRLWADRLPFLSVLLIAAAVAAPPSRTCGRSILRPACCPPAVRSRLRQCPRVSGHGRYGGSRVGRRRAAASAASPAPRGGPLASERPPVRGGPAAGRVRSDQTGSSALVNGHDSAPRATVAGGQGGIAEVSGLARSREPQRVTHHGQEAVGAVGEYDRLVHRRHGAHNPAELLASSPPRDAEIDL